MGKTALYTRVSTEDQSLDRQQNETYEYATDRLGVEPSSIEVYRDTGTGRNTQRAGFQRLLSEIESGEVDRVVALETTRLSRSMADLSATVEKIVEEHNCGLHLLDLGVGVEPDEDLDPFERAFIGLAASMAELEVDMLRERTISGIQAARDEGKWHGRPPFGFTTGDEGYLRPSEDFDRAIAVFELFSKGWSKRSIAEHTGVPRSTVSAIVDRHELYSSHAGGDVPDPSERPETTSRDDSDGLEEKVETLESRLASLESDRGE